MCRTFAFVLLAMLIAVNAVPSAAQTDPRAITALPADGGEKRIALVIGNSSYASSPLKNPANDARAIAKALQGVGFEVILKLNATQKQMRRAMIAFGRRLKDGGVGLFYYAGHGVQLDGSNYLIPVGADIDAEEHVEIEAVELNQILGRMGGARNRLNIVVLDACRNNPFARSFRSTTRGLAQTLAPAGTYIAYATAPGDVAEDGDGRNSLYTQALTRWIQKPNLKIEDVFKRVRNRVYRDTDGRQVPWTSSSITGDFFFQPTPKPKVAAAPRVTRRTPAAPMNTGDLRAMDFAFWREIQASRSADDFHEYLRQFPKGVYSRLARNRIAALQSPARRPETRNQSRKTAAGNDKVQFSAAPKRPATKPAQRLPPVVQRPLPTPRKAPQLAAVDPTARPAAVSKSDFSGTWVGADGLWQARLNVRQGKIDGTLECAVADGYGSASSNANLARFSDKATRVRLRGTVDSTGRVEAEVVVGPGVNYRKLTGRLPTLKLWDVAQCGGAAFTMRREDGGPASSPQGRQPRPARPKGSKFAAVNPKAANSSSSHPDFSGTWVGADKLWKAELTLKDGVLEGYLRCAIAEPAGGGRGTSSNVGGMSESTVARLRGKVTGTGRIDAETTGADTNYRRLYGTLPKLTLWDVRPCGGAHFVMRRQGGGLALSPDERLKIESALRYFYDREGNEIDAPYSRYGYAMGNILSLVPVRKAGAEIRIAAEFVAIQNRNSTHVTRKHHFLLKSQGGKYTVIKMTRRR